MIYRKMEKLIKSTVFFKSTDIQSAQTWKIDRFTISNFGLFGGHFWLNNIIPHRLLFAHEFEH